MCLAQELLFIIIYSLNQMGSITSYICGTHPQAQKILQTLEIAIQNEQDCEEGILSQHKTLLHGLVKTAQPTAETIGHLSIQISLMQKAKLTNNQKSSETDMKVVLRNEKEQGKSERSGTTAEDIIKPGYIIFSAAYYKGDISRGKAHGKGELHFPQAGYEVKGEWKHDSLRCGNVYKVAPQYTNQQVKMLFSLQLRNGENNAVIKARDFEYIGSITLEGSTTLSQILTGNGEIRYSNGDIYKGRLVNGLYETIGSHSAILTYSKGALKSYQGLFKGGLREDRGKLTFRQNNSDYTVNMGFSKGVPTGKGEIRIDNQHYSFEASDNLFTDIKQSE